MENKNAIIAAVVAVIVIVAAVGIYYGMNNGNDGGDETPSTGWVTSMDGTQRTARMLRWP